MYNRSLDLKTELLEDKHLRLACRGLEYVVRMKPIGRDDHHLEIYPVKHCPRVLYRGGFRFVIR